MSTFAHLRARAARLVLPFTLTLVAVGGGGLALIERLPDVYESRARIVIERPDTPIVGSESGDQDALSQRLQIIIESVLGRDNVAALLEEQGLLAPEGDPITVDAAVGDFRDAATVEIANASVVNPYTGKLGLLPFGVDVAYRSDVPRVAFDIATRLSSAILTANTGQNQLTTDETSVFLEAEMAKREATLEGIEQRIADYKNDNARYLPELYPVAVRRLEELDRQVQTTRNRISDLGQDRAQASAELATSNPEALLFAPDGTRIEGTDERIRRLRIDYGIARSKYSDDHPEVVRLARELRVLEGEGGAIDTSDLERRLADTRLELADAMKRYSAEHPDTIRLVRKERALENELEAMAARAASTRPRATSIPSNPAYNRSLVKRRSIEDRIDEEQRRLGALAASIEEIDEQLARMPPVEQRLAELERQRGAETAAYEELATRLTESRLNAGLRQASLLDRLTVLEAPTLPIEPIAPRRSLIAAVLALFALALATAVALWTDWRRDALWTVEDVRELIDADVELIPRFGR